MSQEVAFQPPVFEPPPERWYQRINLRVLIFVGLIVAVIGVPFYMWVDEALSGGIHNRGAYKEVDLKAMSTFDMDQMNATVNDIPKKWVDLDGKDVLMVGEMWNPTVAGDQNLSYFQLVYSKTKCCFNGPPLAQHFVDGYVKVPGVFYYDVPVKVRGKLHVYIRKDQGGVIKSIYHVDVTELDPIES